MNSNLNFGVPVLRRQSQADAVLAGDHMCMFPICAHLSEDPFRPSPCQQYTEVSAGMICVVYG